LSSLFFGCETAVREIKQIRAAKSMVERTRQDWRNRIVSRLRRIAAALFTVDAIPPKEYK
jgi:hypothetical protein